MKRLPQFDVFKAGMIGGRPLGDYLETIGASSHQVAKLAAERLYAGIAHVVVMPAGRVDSTPHAVTNRDFSPRGAHPRSSVRHAPRTR